MATRSVKLNDLEDRVEIINADIKTIDKELEVHGYHVATSNPPYMHMDGIKNPNDKKTVPTKRWYGFYFNLYQTGGACKSQALR